MNTLTRTTWTIALDLCGDPPIDPQLAKHLLFGKPHQRRRAGTALGLDGRQFVAAWAKPYFAWDRAERAKATKKWSATLADLPAWPTLPDVRSAAERAGLTVKVSSSGSLYITAGDDIHRVSDHHLSAPQHLVKDSLGFSERFEGRQTITAGPNYLRQTADSIIAKILASE